MDHYDKNTTERPVIALTARQASIVSACAILIMFFIFIAGYFYGQKRAAEQFTYRIDQESLADQIYSSMCGLYDNKSEDDLVADDVSAKTDISDPKTNQGAASSDGKAKVIEKKYTYYAQLDKFGSKADAQKYVDRLIKQGLTVTIEEGSSRSGKQVVVWYQVVTNTYKDKNALVQALEKIKRIETIKNIRIVSA